MLDGASAELHPAYFALVMATGIVSIACYLLGMDFLVFPLFYLNQFFYAALWLLTLARLFRHFPRVRADLSNHNLSAGFFTIVAGTNILGSQFAVLKSDWQPAILLWLLGALLWLVLIYAFFTIMTVKEAKPTLETGINGAWLVTVVSTQSIAVLGTLIASRFATWEEMFLFAMLCFYLLGCMFYILIISLIFYRFMFYKLDPRDLTPPYWINMGAIAITTLAGSMLILQAGHSKLILDIKPFLIGMTLLFWATATWWIPLLVILGAWRHGYKGVPLVYGPPYWSLVFPLGMYTVCTFQLAKALGVDSLMVIPQYFVYPALLAWLLTAYGLARRLLTAFRQPLTSNP